MSQPFQFKQFSVKQDASAMKIGTDGVLLGAWVQIDSSVGSILDIGAGTGVIALQMAQRSAAELIDALEIDDAAYEECTLNFENSPWADRLFCYHAGLLEFTEEIDEQYQLIVSNPPFYSEDFKTGKDKRDLARFSDAMPFEHLAVCAAHLLSEDGQFAVIIPAKEEDDFIALAAQAGLFPVRICRVQGNPEADVKRVLLQFSRQKLECSEESLVIETDRHAYTEDYISLVKDFYLKL